MAKLNKLLRFPCLLLEGLLLHFFSGGASPAKKMFFITLKILYELFLEFFFIFLRLVGEVLYLNGADIYRYTCTYLDGDLIIEGGGDDDYWIMMCGIFICLVQVIVQLKVSHFLPFLSKKGFGLAVKSLVLHHRTRGKNKVARFSCLFEMSGVCLFYVISERNKGMLYEQFVNASVSHF